MVNNIHDINARFSPIASFYKNKSVFVTGGTGSLGTVLIEKLLYACNELSTIYILIRSKNEESAQQRLSKFICSEGFQRINKLNPNAMMRIIPITGDLLMENIGISDRDKETLQKEVSVVFHVAANVQFDVPIADALNINTKATQKVVTLCKGMRQLQAFVYVSTAYTNSNNALVCEKVYKTPYPLEAVYHVVEELGDHRLVEKMLGGRPNTYTYTKALSEELIEHEIDHIPAVIVRPSIITPALKDPMKGFINGWSGGIFVVGSVGKGANRCWIGDPDAISDIIPVDIVANLLVAAAWDAHERRVTGVREIKVFNCCSGLQNPVTLGRLLWTSLSYSRKHFKRETKLTPTLLIVKNWPLYFILTFFIQIVPAFLCDCMQYILGYKKSMLKMQRRIRRLALVLGFFTINEFIFVDYNVKDLYNKLNDQDRILFDFNVKNIEWEDYIEHFVLGVKKYLLKE